MARIIRFHPITTDRARLHRTQVECGYAVVEIEGTRYLQLETYGSSERKIPGKISQTLQLDEERAADLERLLHIAFPRN